MLDRGRPLRGAALGEGEHLDGENADELRRGNANSVLRDDRMVAEPEAWSDRIADREYELFKHLLGILAHRWR